MRAGPVRIVVTDDLTRPRVTVLFRLLLALPHLLILGVLIGVAVLLAPIAWLLALFYGRLPGALHEFLAMVVRYSTHVYAYLYLGAQAWPPVAGAHEYAIDVVLPEHPERQSRWSIGFRGLLALPALLLAGAMGTGAFAAGSVLSLGVAPLVAVLAWFACLVRGAMPRGMRDLLAWALGYGAQVSAYLLLVTDRYPDSDPALTVADPLPAHPVGLTWRDDGLERMRLLVVLRWPLTFPHLLWLALWTLVALPIGIVGWLAALATGRLPRFAHRFLAARLRYATHVTAYVTLAAELFPGFTGAPGAFPADLEIAAPERQPRWTVLLRGILILPALLLAGAIGTLQWLGAILAWVAALLTGRMPRGLRGLQVFALRYQGQVGAYLALLTPVYPYSGPGPREP